MIKEAVTINKLFEGSDDIEKIIENVDLNEKVPEEEPYRQYYFIKKARNYVDELAKELGRRPTACSIAFGCQI